MKAEKVQKLLTMVRRNYQEIATDFDITRKKEIWPEIRVLAEKVKDGDRVLDLGCGNGRLLEALKEKQINYLGVDNSANLISLAKNNYPHKQFIVADILDLDSSDEVIGDDYDFIFCLAVLQHLPGEELRVRALKEMAKRLKESGEIIISNWNLWAFKKHRQQLIKNYFLKLFGHYEFEANDLIFPWKNSQGEEKTNRYYHAFTKRELKKLARLAGFKILSCKKERNNFWLILKK